MLNTIETRSTPLPMPRPQSRYHVRRLKPSDFPVLQQLEEDIWGSAGEAMLCSHYLRLCVEQFPDVCFIAFDGDKPVGYVLNFVRGTVAHCGTLAVHRDYRRSRVTYLLVTAMLKRMLTMNITECWFTVSPENTAAREVHANLGARVIDTRENYYGPGDTRLLSVISAEQMDRLRRRFLKAA